MGSHDLKARNRKIVFHGIWNPRAWNCELRCNIDDVTTAGLKKYLNTLMEIKTKKVDML